MGNKQNFLEMSGQETKDQINQVSDTAFMAAAYRAMETNHPNAIFHDPLAEKLAGDRGKRIIDSLPKKAFIGGWSVVIRTRIIDDFIQGAIVDDPSPRLPQGRI